jgi:L-alanine-DL-glutamate epimerase-like enolase superfamily enzyme
MKLTIAREIWQLRSTFRISRKSSDALEFVVVTLEDDRGCRGRGEAAGVDYVGEDAQSLVAELEAVRPAVEAGIDRDRLQHLLGPGGARNALDCALWDLAAKQTGVRAWSVAGVTAMRPVVTAYTIGLGTKEEVLSKARAASSYPVLKVKVDATHHLELVEAVHSACPSARIIVDANQAWSIDLLDNLSTDLSQMNVVLIEQPLPTDADPELDGYEAIIPLAADESCTDRSSLPGLVGRFDVVNIKLDKAGGLTEALAMVGEARRMGFGLMVGCNVGTSLAMAPAAIVAQSCEFVDLDGPLLQAADREHAIAYDAGVMAVPSSSLWG